MLQPTRVKTARALVKAVQQKERISNTRLLKGCGPSKWALIPDEILVVIRKTETVPQMRPQAPELSRSFEAFAAKFVFVGDRSLVQRA